MDQELIFVNIDDQNEQNHEYPSPQDTIFQTAACSRQPMKAENISILKIEDVPLVSGYLARYSDQKMSKELPSELSPEEKEYNRTRLVAWKNITHCPECKGTELFRYHDTSNDRYFVSCENVPAYVYKELDSLCKGVEFKPSIRSKNNGIVPLSFSVKSVEEYVGKIQDSLCGWVISL